MKLPLQVTFRDLVPLPSLEGDIRRRAAKLEEFAPDLSSCHVVVEATGNRHHQGHRYLVKIDLRLPGEVIFTGQHHGNEDVELAVRGAFDAMARRLEDHVRQRRGQVKQHAPKARATLNSEAGSGEAQEDIPT
jgi:ribosome-associated translation inhibitor RaiA